uniref:Phosphorylase b kinase regulatory subunit n=1 Tax=Steinernema glaseri TaxID=37863 RepID=A0A1I7ZGP2_9BILA
MMLALIRCGDSLLRKSSGRPEFDEDRISMMDLQKLGLYECTWRIAKMPQLASSTYRQTAIALALDAKASTVVPGP